MRVIGSKPSISVWVTNSNAVSLVILKYSCIIPVGRFISLRKVIISMSLSCVFSAQCTPGLQQRWANLQLCLALFPQAISGLTQRDGSRAVAGLAQFLWAGVCDTSAFLCLQCSPLQKALQQSPTWCVSWELCLYSNMPIHVFLYSGSLVQANSVNSNLGSR